MTDEPLGPVPVTTDLDLTAAEAASERSGLGRQAARGAVLTISAQLVKILLQVAGVVVLARLLTPGDYGLVAMVTAIVGVAEIFRDFGLSAAAVQAKHLSRAQRDNLFWINTAAGAVLTALVFLGAPLIAMFYGHPELIPLTHVIAFVFLANGMTTQYRADLNRRLKFSRIAVIDIAAPLIALVVAIIAALSGLGYWSLVIQQLVMAAILLVGAAGFAGWLPGRPRRREAMGNLMTFGWHLVGSQFLGYLANNVDSLTIGSRFGATSLGLYNRAFQLLMTPLGQLRAPTTTVALPVLARLRNDLEGSNRYIQRGQLALGLTMVTGLGFIVGAAEPVTSIFLGAQWLSVEPILRLLAIAGMFQTLAYVGYWVYLSHGLTKQLLQYTVITVTIKVTCILVGSHWGLIGVAWGYAIAPAVAWPRSFWWLSRSSTLSVKGLFIGAGRVLLITAVIALGSYGACILTDPLGRWVQLGAALVASAACYCLALLVPPLRRDILGVVQIGRRGMKNR